MIHHWTLHEKDFIRKHFANFGAVFCAEHLNLPTPSVRAQASFLKVRTIKRFKVNPLNFIKVTSKEAAYILGFIWGDGTLQRRKNTNMIVIRNLSKDINDIRHVFTETGEWNFINFIRKNNKGGFHNEQTEVNTSNRVLVDFLCEHNYHNKSGGCALSILSTIPDELKRFWYRGLLDADGCWFSSPKYRNKYISITSVIDQNWNFMMNICDKLSISYNVLKYTDKRNHSCSRFIIRKIKDMRIFINYIYPDTQFDNIGLTRKYVSSQLILTRKRS